MADELFNLKKGDSIFLRGCYGNGWPVEQLEGKNAVVAAGGTGISPVKSLIHMLYENPDYARDYGESKAAPSPVAPRIRLQV